MKKQLILMTATTLVLIACGQSPEDTSKAVEAGKSVLEAPGTGPKIAPPAETATMPVAGVADGAALYEPCAGCHGAKGEIKALGVGAIIAAQSKDDLVMKIKGYQDGSYGGEMKASMTPMVINLNDEQIAEVAEYISGL